MLIYLISCSDDYDGIATSNLNSLKLTDEEIMRLPLLDSNHDVSLDDAQKQAEQIAGMLDEEDINSGKVTLKSLKPRYINNVRVINNCKTKSTSDKDSTEENPKIFLFNFADEKDSVLLSGDNRVPSILSYSSEGNIEDTITNPGLAVFISRVDDYMDREINKIESLKDSIYYALKNKILSLDTNNISIKTTSKPTDPLDRDIMQISYSYSPWVVDKVVGPLVKVEWHQVYPFNYKCPNYSCGNVPAGCVTIAVAQILSYYKYPTYYDWNSIINNDLDNISSFIFNLSKDLKSDYGCSGTSSNINNAYYTYYRLGYSCLGFNGAGADSYNTEKVINSLNNKCPIQISGKAKEHVIDFFIGTYTYYTQGHEWVIDGYKANKQDVTRTISYYQNEYNSKQKKWIKKQHFDRYTSTNYQTLLHCNFGWGDAINRDGKVIYTNGYYNCGVFDSNNIVSKSTSDNSGNYQYLLQILYMIKPKK